MKVKDYYGLTDNSETLQHGQSITAQSTQTDSAKYTAPGKKAKDKKPDYSQQRKQKRGE